MPFYNPSVLKPNLPHARLLMCSFATSAMLITGALQAAKPFEQLSPEDSIAFFKVESIQKSASKWEDFKETYFDQETINHFEKIRKDLMKSTLSDRKKTQSIFNEIEYKPEQFGEMAVYYRHADASDKRSHVFAMVLEYDGDAGSVEQLLETLGYPDELPQKIQVERLQDTFYDETIHIEEIANKKGEVNRISWSMMDGVFILSNHRSAIEDTIEAMKEEAPTRSLADTSNYREAIDIDQKHDFLFFVNGKPLNRLMESEIIPSYEKAFEKGNQGLSKMGVSLDEIWKHLGINHFQSLAWSAGNYRSEYWGMKFGLHYSERKGIFSVLSYHNDNPLPLPKFIPENVLQVGVSNFSVADMYDRIIEIANRLSPQIEQNIRMGLQMVQSQAGINFLENFIYNAGDYLYVVDLPRSKSTDPASTIALSNNIMVMPFEDIDALQTMLKTLFDNIGGGNDIIQTEKYLETTLYYPRIPKAEESQQTISYAFVGNEMLLSTTGLQSLKEFLNYYHNPPEKSIWETAYFQEASSLLPANPHAIGYRDTEGMLSETLEIIKQLDKIMFNESLKGLVKSLPTDIHFPFHEVSGYWMDDRALKYEMIMLPKNTK